MQKLAAHQLTVPDVKRAIEEQALEATSGPRGGFQFTPNARGGLNVDQLASIAIKSDPNGTAIRLDEVKSIIRSSEDLIGFASLDGNSVAVLEVYALAGADPHAVSAAVLDQLPELRESLPPGPPPVRQAAIRRPAERLRVEPASTLCRPSKRPGRLALVRGRR